MVRTHTFNGKKYKIEIFPDGLDGVADTKEKLPSMVIARDPNTKNGLITIIHEAMHCGNWDKHEETIDRTSKEIGTLLWRLGYRQKSKNKTGAL